MWNIVDKKRKDPGYKPTNEELLFLQQNEEFITQLNINSTTLESNDNYEKLENIDKESMGLQCRLQSLAESNNGVLTVEMAKANIEKFPEWQQYIDFMGIDLNECVKVINENQKPRFQNKEVKKMEEHPELQQYTELTGKDYEYVNENKKPRFQNIEAEKLEEYFDNAFKLAIDPASLTELKVEDIYIQDESGQESKLEEKKDRDVKETNIHDVSDINKSGIDSRVPEEEEVSQNEDEQAYEAPTFEIEEKKGLAKLFDKFRNSNNPIARMLFSRSKKVQTNDAKRLEAGSVERKATEYKEAPSTSRFDLSDSELMPRGLSIRNTFIRMGETVAKIFGKKDKEAEPAQTLVPQTPSTSFDSIVKKGIDDKVMDKIAGVSKQVVQDDKPIVPKAVGKGENSKPSGPSLDEK